MQQTLNHNKASLPYKNLRGPAKFISYLFHPTFMPTAMALLVMYLCRAQFAAVEKLSRMQWIGNVALNTIVFPVITVLLLKSLGFINSIHLRDKKERIIPLMATMIFYFWTYWIFKNIDAPLALRVLLLGAFWGIILLFLINIFVKISLHSAAAGGAVGLMLVLMMISQVNVMIPFLVVLLVAGLIGTARLVLQAHRPIEIWLGYGLGIVVQLLAYAYLY